MTDSFGNDPASGNPTGSRDADRVRLFTLSTDLLCVAGLDGYFKEINPSWTRVLGWSEAELLARPVVEFLHPDDRKRTLDARSALARGLPVSGLENRYLCRDGSFRWLSWQSTSAPDGGIVFGVARDVTERRQADHERLILGKLESTGMLAAGIAHDFNNLLTSVLLNVEMVALSGPVNEQQQDNLSQANQAVQAAKGITQQLLTIARGGDEHRRVADLRVILQSSLDLALSGSNVLSLPAIADDLWPTEVNESQIAQVVRNLVFNAREAMPSGGTVRLEAGNAGPQPTPSHEVAAGDHVFIRVIDEGVGIDPEIKARIFDPYFSTKQRGVQKGMGLGLTICHSIVKSHRGTMDVDSTPGSGTTVTCLLPAAKSPLTPPAAEPQGMRQEAVRRVLVMDDEAFIRQVIASVLGKLGHEVVAVANGEAAVEVYEQAREQGNPFSTVLLDLTVRGGMGGAEALQVLRQRDPGIQAVLMTGQANEAAFQDFRRLGFMAALQKPFTIGSLGAVLSALPLANVPELTGGRGGDDGWLERRDAVT